VFQRPKAVQFVIDPFQYPVSGAEIRNDALYRAFAAVAETTVISPQQFSSFGKRVSICKSVPTLLNPDESCVQNFVKFILAEKPDILLVEGVGLLNFYIGLLSAGHDHVPLTILDCHNVESALLEELRLGNLGCAKHAWRSFRHSKAIANARLADRKAVTLFDRILVPTPEDRNRLVKLAGSMDEGSKIRVVNNLPPAWALDHLEASENGVQDRLPPATRLLFVGHLRYQPNMEAVKDMLQSIWPAVLDSFGDMRLVVAGRNPPRWMKRRIEAAAKVELCADPASMATLYDACDAVIIPLSSGGGSRLKVLEALAVGKPVVASEKAVEGLGLVDRIHFMKAETPDDYVAAIGMIRANPGLVKELIDNGRKLVRERFGRSLLDDGIKNLLLELDFEISPDRR